MMRLSRTLPLLLIVCFLGFLYLRTLAPGLTWAFDSADGGDLVTAAVTGGVPHPTGYPTYLVVASAFLQLPLGSFAFRTNVLSLVAALLAAGLLYRLVLTAAGDRLAASIAALAGGTAPLFWSQAIVTEVYALQALLVVGMLNLLIAGPRRLNQWLAGVVCGLGIGNHLSGALLLPLLLLVPAHRAEPRRTGTAPAQPPAGILTRAYLRRFLGLCLGLSIYLLIPLRANSGAPVNWGNAVSLPALLSVVTGQMYWSRIAVGSAADLLSGLRSWAHLLADQWGAPGVLLAGIGLAVTFRPSVIHLAGVWIAAAFSLLAIVYRAPDSYVYLIPVLIALSVWIGLGGRWLVERAFESGTSLGIAAFALFAAFFVLRGFLAIPRMDLSEDHRAEEFGRAILEAAPAEAIVLSGGDESTFALWYFHYAYGLRPDVAVVSRDLLSEGWYRDVLQSRYSELAIPADHSARGFVQANPGRSVCRVLSILEAQLACSPKILVRSGRAWRDG